MCPSSPHCYSERPHSVIDQYKVMDIHVCNGDRKCKFHDPAAFKLRSHVVVTAQYTSCVARFCGRYGTVTFDILHMYIHLDVHCHWRVLLCQARHKEHVHSSYYIIRTQIACICTSISGTYFCISTHHSARPPSSCLLR